MLAKGRGDLAGGGGGGAEGGGGGGRSDGGEDVRLIVPCQGIRRVITCFPM